MDHEKTEQLFRAAPTFFRRNELPCGFECGDGWFGLLLELAALAEGVNDGKPKSEQCYAVQVKTKFGGLRCYVRGADEVVAAAIDVAEEHAAKTCEECGAPGHRGNIEGWNWLLCRPCFDKKAAGKKKRDVDWRGP